MDSRSATSASNLARKYDFLQERAQRKPMRDASLDLTGNDASKKANISQLKEFYLQRLAKNQPQIAAQLGAQMQRPRGDPAQPEASGQSTARPTFNAAATPAAAPVKDIEDLEIMCNNCFNLISSTDAGNCTGDAGSCPVALRAGSGQGTSKPAGQIQMLDLKLQKLRAALEARLQDSASRVPVMRHLTQLRYHIDSAVKWAPGCTEIGALSDHTVQQVKHLTATSRVLAPAVYIFSKRIENVVVQKERELRKVMVQSSAPKSAAVTYDGGMYLDIERDPLNDSVADVNSVVSEMDSDTGTQCAETLVTQDGPSGTTDVGNVQDANEYLSLKNEDEQRRWFYSQCLTAKLACTDKARARKTLISDLYAKVKEERVPIENWVKWIKMQLMPEDAEADVAGSLSQTTRPIGSALNSQGSTAFGGLR